MAAGLVSGTGWGGGCRKALLANYKSGCLLPGQGKTARRGAPLKATLPGRDYHTLVSGPGGQGT